MSTSILYHPFGIRGVKHCRTRFEQGEIVFEAVMTEALAICPMCGSRDVIYKGARVRGLQMVPIGSKRVWLDLTVHRLGQKTLKGCRFLLLRNYEDLPAKKKARLDRLLKVNEPLLIMHTMKEQLRALWQYFTRRSAASFLTAWSRDAMQSCIPPLVRVGKTLLFYRTFLLNYFSHGIASSCSASMHKILSEVSLFCSEHFRKNSFILHPSSSSPSRSG
jgi:transposase